MGKIKMNVYKTDCKPAFKKDISQLETAGLNYIIFKYLPRFKEETAYIGSGDIAGLYFPNVAPIVKDETGTRVKVECLAVSDTGVPFIISESGETYVISGY